MRSTLILWMLSGSSAMVPPLYDFAYLCPVNLKPVLGKIETNRGNMHSRRLLSVVAFTDDHVMAHRCRGAGAVHPIKKSAQRFCGKKSGCVEKQLAQRAQVARLSAKRTSACRRSPQELVRHFRLAHYPHNILKVS